MIADTWGHGVMRWHACTSMTHRAAKRGVWYERLLGI